MDSESSDETNANGPKTILDACLTDDLRKLQVLLSDIEQLPDGEVGLDQYMGYCEIGIYSLPMASISGFDSYTIRISIMVKI
jgi:hypothetical protein